MAVQLRRLHWAGREQCQKKGQREIDDVSETETTKLEIDAVVYLPLLHTGKNNNSQKAHPSSGKAYSILFVLAKRVGMETGFFFIFYNSRDGYRFNITYLLCGLLLFIFLFLFFLRWS